MEDHDEVCMCFHVTQKTLRKYIRLEKPVRESQLSQCYGAGTGCGWCRPFLAKIFESVKGQASDADAAFEMTAQEYAAARKAYRTKLQKDSE